MRTRKFIDICTYSSSQSEKLFAFDWIFTIKNSRMLLKAQNRSHTPSFLTLRVGMQFWTAPRPIRGCKGLHRWVTQSVTKCMPTRSIGTIVMLCEAQNWSQTPIVPHDKCRATNAGNR
ncbi:hypothetical protein AL057_04010 [Pseudomonas amygdali pv. myricae]|nr:hypothetical protein AL057_04010 [Pseudomonas amygdali pv. myricae]